MTGFRTTNSQAVHLDIVAVSLLPILAVRTLPYKNTVRSNQKTRTGRHMAHTYRKGLCKGEQQLDLQQLIFLIRRLLKPE